MPSQSSFLREAYTATRHTGRGFLYHRSGHRPTGIGKFIAEVANRYGMDIFNVLYLTPLPGTRLWYRMKSKDRIALDTFPEGWKYYTLTFPVARYKNLSLEGIIREMISCNRDFYSISRILHRVWDSSWRGRKLLISLVGNFTYRANLRLSYKAYAGLKTYVKNGI